MNIKGLFSVHRLIVRHRNTRQGHSCTLITPMPCFRFEYWRSAIRSIPFQVGDSPPPSFDVYLQASASLQKICVFFPQFLGNLVMSLSLTLQAQVCQALQRGRRNERENPKFPWTECLPSAACQHFSFTFTFGENTSTTLELHKSHEYVGMDSGL